MKKFYPAKQLGISSCAINCVAGTTITELSKAIRTQQYGPKVSIIYRGHAPGKTKDYPVYCAAIKRYNSYNGIEKISRMLMDTLRSILRFNNGKTLIHTVLPPKNTARSKLFEPEIFQKLIRKLSNATIEFSYCDAGVSKNLTKAISNNNYDSIIFGGIDSLVNSETIQILDHETRLMTTKCLWGIAPGEACCYLQLKKTNSNSALITAIESENELQQNLAKITTTKTKLDRLITSIGTEADDPINWYKITQQLWKHPKIPPPTLSSQQLCGEIGAATIPLQLVLAYLYLKTTTDKNIVICEKCNNYDATGTILLSNQGIKKCNN